MDCYKLLILICKILFLLSTVAITGILIYMYFEDPSKYVVFVLGHTNT